MLFLVLRLLAVYLATAAVSLWFAHKCVLALRLRVGLLLAFGPFLLVGKALLTAGVYAPIDIPYQAPPLSVYAGQVGTRITQNPILGDVVYQEIPWRKAVREAVKNGRLPLWNRFVLAGEPLLAVQQPAVLHPGTWIGFLLPLAQAWTFEMALRFFLALLCAYLFVRDLGCGVLPSLLAAFGWGFCDYMVFYAGYPLSPAAAPFPLLLLGLRRLVSRSDRGAVALTVVALLLILTSGHPETLLHAVAGAGIFFLFELGFAARGRRLRPLLLSLSAGILTLGISAVLLIPLFEILPHSAEHRYRSNTYARLRRSTSLQNSVRRTLPALMPAYYGVSGKGNVKDDFAEPASYAGTVLWPLAAVGLFSRRREKWPIVIMGILGVAVGARLLGVMDAISALPFFDIAMNERMFFLAAFATAALAALGLERLQENKGARLAAAATLVAIAALAVLYFKAQAHLPLLQMPPGYFLERALLEAIPLGIFLMIAILNARGAWRFGSAAVLLLLIAQRGLEEREVYPTYGSKAFYPTVRTLSAIPRKAPERMTAVGYTFIPNIAAMYEVEDVRGYEAMTFAPLVDTFPLWCVAQPVWYNRVDDPARPFLSFLNVRYVFAPRNHSVPAGWKTLFAGEEGQLLENPNVIARAFVPRLLRYEPDASRQVEALQGIGDFARQGVVGENPPAGTLGGGPVENGEATVRILSYEPERLALEIRADETAVVATSVTSWPGWKLTVDGVSAPLLPYNRAFHAFRVSPGSHTAVLRYWPDTFVAGSVISLVTLAAGLFLLTRAHRATSPRPSG